MDEDDRIRIVAVGGKKQTGLKTHQNQQDTVSDSVEVR